MTTDELIALSKAAAKVAGIEPFYLLEYTGSSRREFWLYEDSARCFELLCLYSNNRAQATRVAILKAIVAQGEVI